MIFLFCTLNNEQRELVEQIFHKHNMQFQRIAFKIVKSEAMAEDAVGTAFIKIMDNIEKISNLPDQKMKAFCVVIVKNTSIDMIRQSQKMFVSNIWKVFRIKEFVMLRIRVFIMLISIN